MDEFESHPLERRLARRGIAMGPAARIQVRHIAIISRTPLPREAIRPTSVRTSKATPKSELLPATEPAVNKQPMLTMSIAASQATKPPFIREARQLAGSGGE